MLAAWYLIGWPGGCRVSAGLRNAKGSIGKVELKNEKRLQVPFGDLGAVAKEEAINARLNHSASGTAPVRVVRRLHGSGGMVARQIAISEGWDLFSKRCTWYLPIPTSKNPHLKPDHYFTFESS